MSSGFILIESIDFQLGTEDPFISCMHHEDDYPKGKENLGPNLEKYYRPLGQDFSKKNGFNMYYGEEVPGYPVHPHKGYETISIVLEGVVDHFDCKGGEGRYADGDVYWLTAGKGFQHAEMFPLVYDYQKNPLEMFQIWLNLPSEKKSVEPYYQMLWNEDIPVEIISENAKGDCAVTLIAGTYKNFESLKPAPDSWAADKENNVKIMLIEMEPYSQLTLPEESKTLNRNLYFYKGKNKVEINGVFVSSGYRMKLKSDRKITIHNGKKQSYLLLLEGEPINEPVVKHGPFIMNTESEIQESIKEYKTTKFGGWPWKKSAPLHHDDTIRFAKYLNGKTEKKFEY